MRWKILVVVCISLFSSCASKSAVSPRHVLARAVDVIDKEFVGESNRSRIHTPLNQKALLQCVVRPFEGNCIDFMTAVHMYIVYCTKLTENNVTYRLKRIGWEWHIMPCVYDHGQLFCGDYLYRVQPWRELKNRLD
jgi:hypothetical protein